MSIRKFEGTHHTSALVYFQEEETELDLIVDFVWTSGDTEVGEPAGLYDYTVHVRLDDGSSAVLPSYLNPLFYSDSFGNHLDEEIGNPEETYS